MYIPVIPTKILPPAISDVLDEVSIKGNLPYNFVAASMLSVLSYATSNCSLRYSSTWVVRPNIYIALVARSGSRKTPAIKLALKPLSLIDSKSIKQYNVDLEKFNHSKDASSSKPKLKQMIARDITAEAVAKLFAENDAILVHQDELAGFFKGMNQYKNNGSDQQFWLSLYSGCTMTKNRATCDDVLFSEHPFATIIGGIQPGVLPSIMPAICYEDGLIQRFLFVTDPEDGKPTVMDPEEEPSDRCLEIWTNFVGHLMSYASSISMQFNLKQEAKEHFCKWLNINEVRAADESDFELSTLRKMEEIVLKFALIDHVVKGHESNEIGSDSVDVGIELAEYFTENARNIRDLVVQSPDKKGYVLMLRKLGKRFTTKEAENVAAQLGVASSTCYVWLRICQNHSLIKKDKHGVYLNLL